MISNRTKCDIDWRTLEDTFTLAQVTMGLKVPTPIILVSSSILVPCHSRRVVIQPDRFMYLGESFETIPKKHETDPINYDKVISNYDVIP